MILGLTTDQAILFTLLAAVFALLVWGRWRYDLVAFAALVAALLTGVVPVDRAFSGFGHPATVIIALVLVVSRGLANAGAIELVARWVIDAGRGLTAHIALMAGIAGALSAVMNNVAALALFMPLDLQAAAKAKRSPALTLMPLSFATILGGLVTLIGTPPNIIIAAFREKALGSPFGMFDFAPVGAVTAIVGIIFVALVGWRLIPAERTKHDRPRELFELEDYVAELKAVEGSGIVGDTLGAVEAKAEEHDAVVLGLIRNGQRLPHYATRTKIREGDVLILQAGPEAIEKVAGEFGLEFTDTDLGGTLEEGNLDLLEAVVPANARAEGRSALGMNLLRRYGVALIGVSRQGQRFRARVHRLQIRAGDVLLLLGPGERLGEVVNWLGCLPLAERGLRVVQRRKAGLAIAIFAIAVALASFGVVYLAVALAAVAVLYALFNIVPLSQVYEAVEWPVIVLLGAMIPIGEAMETSGSTALIAQGIVNVSSGYSAAVALILLMAVTMTISDVINNTATAVIAAPIAIETAGRLGANPDPFLMAVAVAASCAFLTPIGHKNNTIIMGPGGYRFGDYWRMGLPLEILVLAVSIPMILLVWPL